MSRVIPGWRTTSIATEVGVHPKLCPRRKPPPKLVRTILTLSITCQPEQLCWVLRPNPDGGHANDTHTGDTHVQTQGQGQRKQDLCRCCQEQVKYLKKRTHVIFSFAFCSFQNFKNLKTEKLCQSGLRVGKFNLLNRGRTYDGAPSFAVKEGLLVRQVKPETETQPVVSRTFCVLPDWLEFQPRRFPHG